MPTPTLHSLDLPEDVRETLEKYLTQLKKAWHSDLEGALLFGSAARGDFITGRSNINILVLVRRISVDGPRLVSAAARCRMTETPRWATIAFVHESG